MQPINENDVLEVVLEGSNEQQPWALVRHYLVTAAADPQDLLDLIVTQYESTILVAWGAVATSLWVAECISISRVAPRPMNVYYKGFVPAVVGDVSTDGLPPMSAVVTRLLTDEVGPRNRGRSYLCGVPEASTNGGVLLASVQEGWQGVADALAQGLSGTGVACSPCIFSRTNYNPTVPPAEAQPVSEYTSAITSATVQGNIATQRRRRTKRSSFSS